MMPQRVADVSLYKFESNIGGGTAENKLSNETIFQSLLDIIQKKWEIAKGNASMN